MATNASIMSSCMSSQAASGASNTAWPVAENLLEASIPGYTIISGIAKNYFSIDLSALVQILLPVAALLAAGRYLYEPIWDYVERYGLSTLEVKFDDEMYNYLMYWISQQKFSNKTSSFVAGTKTSSELVYDIYDDDSDSEKTTLEVEADWQLADESFDKYWAQLTSRDKFKPIYFTPRDGTHWFRFKGHWIKFTRSSREKDVGRWTTRMETLTLSSLGWNTNVLKELVREAQKAYIARDGSSTIIYRKSSDMDDWQRCMSRPPRPLSTVVLDPAQKEGIVDDLKEYLHPLTKRWYANRGIPYRRGYLLHGPPGTGKTSLCVAIAGMFGLKVYVASLNSRTLTEEGLATLFGYLPTRCVILLEDVDSAGITHKRSDGGAGPATQTVTTTDVSSGATGTTVVNANEKPTGITLSALLNIIDGVASSEGRILIMTTNHVEKLDPALLRPGRVDMSIAFENASSETAAELFRSTYVSRAEDFPGAHGKIGDYPRKFRFTEDQVAELAKEFAEKIPSGEFSPADIQGYLLKHKASPDVAAKGVSEWAEKVREEKERMKKSEIKEIKDKDEAKLSETPVIVEAAGSTAT